MGHRLSPTVVHEIEGAVPVLLPLSGKGPELCMPVDDPCPIPIARAPSFKLDVAAKPHSIGAQV